MQELEFLQNIHNKEIIIEILHHSVDHLISNKDEQQTLKLCDKYGFNSPDEFMLVIRNLAHHYRNCCIENVPCETEFEGLNPDLLRLVSTVFAARKPEIVRFLVRWFNSQEDPFVESFDWDLRRILGDSSYAQNERQIITCTFNCRKSNSKSSVIHFQMDFLKLNELIAELERAENDLSKNNKINY